jgi:hypothetical protein
MNEIKIGMIFEIPESSPEGIGNTRHHGYFKVIEKHDIGYHLEGQVKGGFQYWCEAVHVRGLQILLYQVQIEKLRIIG